MFTFTQTQKENDFLKLQKHMKERFFVGRLSGNETRLAGLVLNNKPIDNKLIQNMLYGAGIQFKTKNDLIDYVNLYDTACKNSTMLGVWDGGMYAQAELYYEYIEKYKINKICAHSLEPYYFMHMPEYDFSSLLKKKVLIITSHYETTKSQIKQKQLNKIHLKPIFYHTDKDTDMETEFIVYKWRKS
jgi:hypothetical protein